MSVNLRNVYEKVSEKVPFNCNGTLTGKWETDQVNFGWVKGMTGVDLANHLLATCHNYVVYSYDTPIAVYNHNGWFCNPDKYTVTTSRHLSAIRKGIM